MAHDGPVRNPICLSEAQLPPTPGPEAAGRQPTRALGHAAVVRAAGRAHAALAVTIRGPADGVAGSQRRAHRAFRAAIRRPARQRDVVGVSVACVQVKHGAGPEHAAATDDGDGAVLALSIARGAADAASALRDRAWAGADGEGARVLSAEAWWVCCL